jgi:hypothetical protein
MWADCITAYDPALLGSEKDKDQSRLESEEKSDKK